MTDPCDCYECGRPIDPSVAKICRSCGETLCPLHVHGKDCVAMGES